MNNQTSTETRKPKRQSYVAVYLDDATYNALRRASYDRHEPMSALVGQLIKTYLLTVK